MAQDTAPAAFNTDRSALPKNPVDSRKRNKKVAVKHGFEGARERIVAWHGWRVCALVSPRGRPYPRSSPCVLHAEVLSPEMHSNLFVTLPTRHEGGHSRGPAPGRGRPPALGGFGFDAATALDTVMDRGAPQPTLVELLV